MAALEAKALADGIGGVRKGLFVEASWPSTELRRFFETLPAESGLNLNPWMTFTKGDIERARFLNMRPGKILRETDADYDAMRAHIDGLPWLGGEPPFRCRLPTALTLSAIELNANQFGVVGHWSAEYIVPVQVRELIEAAELSSCEFRPVTNRKTGRPFDEFAQLYTDHLLAGRVIDVTSPEIQSANPAERGYDLLGCFCFSPDTLNAATDFNRVGESTISFEFGDWIVSQAVRELMVAEGIKGLRFEPVLESGTEEYAAYMQLWTDFLTAVPDNCTIRGKSAVEICP